MNIIMFIYNYLIEPFWYVWLLIIIINLILIILIMININHNKRKNQFEKLLPSSNISYSQKGIMTATEYKFYRKLKKLEDKYIIHPQLSLASITKKTGRYRYASELNRIIDFAIFDAEYKKLLLLIELNDATHKQIERRDRDLKVKKLCKELNVPLIFFYTSYPNEEDYVIKRIKKIINENNADSL